MGRNVFSTVRVFAVGFFFFDSEDAVSLIQTGSDRSLLRATLSLTAMTGSPTTGDVGRSARPVSSVSSTATLWRI